MRRYVNMLAVALVALAAPSCNVLNDYGNAACKQNPAWCATGGAGGGSTGLVCLGGTTLYACNIDNAQFRDTSTEFSFFAQPGCGLGFCANSSDVAKNQAAAFTGVDPQNPWLVCLNTGTTTEAGFKALFTAVGALPGVDLDDFESLCVAAPGTKTCLNPCDDGAGGALQSVGQTCWGPPACCAGLTCVDYGSSTVGHCEGSIPKCSPQSPPVTNWQGLTTTKLRQIAIANNIDGCAGQTGITQSRTIGVAFERWVLTWLGAYPEPPKPGRNNMLFMSMERQTANKANGGLPASVIPELIGDQPMFPQSIFYEVKAVTANLTPGTSSWQILGLLDVARTVPTVPAGPHPPPVVYFITTSNTQVSSGVLSYGNMWNVAVWQQTVLYDASGGQNPNLIPGAAKCLSSPSLCMNSALTLTSPGPAVSTLTSPTTPPSALIVPGDPDPAEVN